MTAKRRPGRLSRAVRALLGPSGTVRRYNYSTRYRPVWLDQPTYEGVAMLAMFRQQTITARANDLMRSAIALEIADIIRKANQEELARREQRLPPGKPNQLIQELRRRAMEQGYDISAFIRRPWRPIQTARRK